MTSAGVASPPTPPSGSLPRAVVGHAGAPAVSYASWTRRVFAALLDDALLGGVTWLALGNGALAPTLTPTFWTSQADGDGASWWHSLWVVGAFVVLLALQADTGWTPGKLVAGIAVVRERDLRPAGILRTLARLAAHLLDAILMIGYLRPLWEAKRRTFADSMLDTVVVLRRPQGLRPGWELALTGAALAVCLAGLGLQHPWASGGGSELVADASCTPVAAPGHADVADGARVDVAVSDSWGYERHLWLHRWKPATREYEVTWQWPAGTLPVGGDTLGEVGIETTVTGPTGESVTGSYPVREGEFSDEVATVQYVDGGDPSATARLEDESPAALDADRLTTSLTLDGVPVATCTIDPLRDPRVGEGQALAHS